MSLFRVAPTVTVNSVRFVRDGSLKALSNSVAHTNTTNKALFTLPKGARIVGWLLTVTTGFNASVSNTLNVGITGTTNKFAAVAAGVAGVIGSGIVAAELNTPLAADTPVVGVFVPDGDPANAGTAIVTCLFTY